MVDPNSWYAGITELLIEDTEAPVALAIKATHTHPCTVAPEPLFSVGLVCTPVTEPLPIVYWPLSTINAPGMPVPLSEYKHASAFHADTFPDEILNESVFAIDGVFPTHRGAAYNLFAAPIATLLSDVAWPGRNARPAVRGPGSAIASYGGALGRTVCAIARDGSSAASSMNIPISLTAVFLTLSNVSQCH